MAEGIFSERMLREFAERRETIELVRAKVRQMVGDDLAYHLDEYRLKEYRAEQLAAMVVELERDIQAQRLEDDVVPVHFRTVVEANDHTVNAYRMPATWWDHWKLDHPTARRRLRLGPIRWVRSGFGLRRTKRHHEVEIHETVTVERRLTYPHSTCRLPENTFGPAVYREIRRTSW